MNYKRKGPKSTRSGCLLCKPHKHQGHKHKDKAQQKRHWREVERTAYEGGKFYGNLRDA